MSIFKKNTTNIADITYESFEYGRHIGHEETIWAMKRMVEDEIGFCEKLKLICSDNVGYDKVIAELEQIEKSLDSTMEIFEKDMKRAGFWKEGKE